MRVLHRLENLPNSTDRCGLVDETLS